LVQIRHQRHRGELRSPLDVNSLGRRGLLEPGTRGSVSWSKGEDALGFVGFEVKDGSCKNGGDGLYGNTGRDFIEGGVGNDTIRGNQQPDTILAGSGADTLYGDEGPDHLVGASGRDTLYAYGDGRRDRINCGADFDRAYVDRDDIVGETCERVRLGKP
jgi:Ca2+-binding RTX toxin-like protein